MQRFLSRLHWWDRGLLLLVAAYLLLWPVEPLSRFVHGLRVFLQAVIYLAATAVLVRLAARIGVVVARRFLWRVQHRMAVAYLFVGVLPLALALLLGVFGVLLSIGPLAAYIVSARVEERAAAFYATADSLAWELRAAPTRAEAVAAAERFLTEAGGRFPGLMARFETERGPVSLPSSFRNLKPPKSLESYRGLVSRGGDLFLSAYAEYAPGSPSLLLMVPLTPQYLLGLAPGLGIVELNRGSAGPAAPPGAVEAAQDESISLEERRLAERRLRALREAQQRPLAARLPAPAFPLDWAIRWEAQTPVLTWETGEIEAANPLALRTRPSAVARLILRSQTPRMRSLAANLGRTLLILFLVALLISTVVAVSLTRTITTVIHDLYTGTQYIDKGEFSYRVPVRGRSQLTELARSFNEMTASIERLIEDSKEREKLESELAIAHEVQKQLFPREPPQLATLEVLGLCRPARTVSGDFYDYVPLSSNRIALTFGDVSGKGISAALVMAAVHSTVRTQLGRPAESKTAELRLAAARLVSETNRQLCAGTAPEKFATLFFGVYDEAGGALAYANAGHLPPLLIRRGEIRPLEVTGMVVGAFPLVEYESRVVTLDPGDLFVAFTDGVTEPENPYGEEFGEQRLQDVLLREVDRPLDEIIHIVMDEVNDWTGRGSALQDDMTLLVARRLG